MFVFTRLLRLAVCIAGGILTVAVVQPACAEGCRGGGGMGYMRGGGGGGGYLGGGYSGGYNTGGGYSGYGGYGYGGNGYGAMGNSAAGYMGGTSASGSCQSSGGSGRRNYSFPQQSTTGSASAGPNNPATVLAHADDLQLNGKQVQTLQRMQSSGRQRAMLVLTTAQRKQLVALVGPVRHTSS